MMPIPEADMRRIRTYIGELKLAGHRVHDHGDPTARGNWSRYDFRQFPSRTRVFVVGTRIFHTSLAYNPYARKRKWGVWRWRRSKQAYVHLDSALDAISDYVREYMRIPTSGIANV